MAPVVSDTRQCAVQESVELRFAGFPHKVKSGARGKNIELPRKWPFPEKTFCQEKKFRLQVGQDTSEVARTPGRKKFEKGHFFGSKVCHVGSGGHTRWWGHGHGAAQKIVMTGMDVQELIVYAIHISTFRAHKRYSSTTNVLRSGLVSTRIVSTWTVCNVARSPYANRLLSTRGIGNEMTCAMT